jgi:hypothetical protein
MQGGGTSCGGAGREAEALTNICFFGGKADMPKCAINVAIGVKRI